MWRVPLILQTPTTRGMALHARVTEDGYFFVGVDGMDNFSTPPGSPDPGPPPNMKWRRRRLGRNNNNDKNYVWEKDRFPLSRDFGACEAIVERRLNILPPEQHVEHIKCGFYCVQIVKCLLDAGNNWENVEPLPKDNRLTDAPDLCELLNSSQVLRKSPKRAFFTRISRNGGIMKTVYHEDKTKAEAEAVNDLGENLEVNMPDSIASYRPYHKIGRPLLDILADSSMENPLICSITDDTPNGFQGHWIVVAGSLPKNIDNERMETFYKVYDPLRGPLFCDIAASDFFRCYDSVFVHSAGDHALRKKLKNERGNASEVKLQKFTLNPGIETLVFLR